ncbi:hypothetical protein KVV02_003934 [Mortierella alpina]|uniref:Uncharacterized protein n=1 Tax=Mortierella alpina TaxID=64518 RepID=A0A9P7ZW37_MORAP|nr:hypothetical protein KVV02_003934 [Mortierella alpina]
MENPIYDRLEAQERRLDAQDWELDELRANASLGDLHVSQKARSTTLTPYPELIEHYPAVGEEQFFEAALPKDHKVFTMAEYHYNSLKEYQAPALDPLGGHLKLVFAFLNTLRILLGDIAGQMSQSRREGCLRPTVEKKSQDKQRSRTQQNDPKKSGSGKSSSKSNNYNKSDKKSKGDNSSHSGDRSYGQKHSKSRPYDNSGQGNGSEGETRQ